MVALALIVLMAAPESRQSVVEKHNRCRRERRSPCVEAFDSYPLYLLQRPDDSEMRYFYAELLWESARYAEAAVEYRHVALDANCRFAKNAAHDYVLARAELVKPTAPYRYDGNPWPLNVEQQDLVDAVDFYLALYPTEKNAEEVAWKAANLYFNAYDFVQAEHRLSWMVLHFGTDYARDLLAEIENERKRERQIGESQTIGTPQTIGESQDIGQPQDIGGSDTVDYEPEAGEDVSEEYVVE